MNAHKIDGNQPEIVAALRKIPGCSVAILSHVGHGCPDIAVGFMGRNFLFEIKDPDRPPSARKLTADERAWHDKWRGQVDIIETALEAMAVMGCAEPAPAHWGKR